MDSPTLGATVAPQTPPQPLFRNATWKTKGKCGAVMSGKTMKTADVRLKGRQEPLKSLPTSGEKKDGQNTPHMIFSGLMRPGTA